MRMSVMVPALSVLALSLACQPAEQAQAPPEPEMSPAEAKQVFDDLVEEFDVAVNAEDVDELLSLFAATPASMPPNAPPQEGAEMVRNHWQTNLFDLGDVDVDNVVEGVRVSGDLAVGWGRYTLSITPEEGDAISGVGKWMAIWERQSDGSWLILRNIWNTDQPADM